MSLQKLPKRPYVRTVMPLTGSMRHSEVRLSFQAIAAAKLTLLQLARASQPRATLSAVVRRAVLDYSQKVNSMNPDDRVREAHHVLMASKALLPAPEDMDRTLAGLEVSGADDPLPSLHEVLYGRPPVDAAAIDAAVSERLQAMFPRRFKEG
jgi:hypothetical protein